MRLNEIKILFILKIKKNENNKMKNPSAHDLHKNCTQSARFVHILCS